MSENLSWHVDDRVLQRSIAKRTEKASGQTILRLERMYARASQRGDLRTEESIIRLHGLNAPQRQEIVTMDAMDAELARLNEELARAERAAKLEARRLGDEAVE